MTRTAHDEARREFVTLKYGRTRCHLLRGSSGNVMVDTDLAGTMPALMAALPAGEVEGGSVLIENCDEHRIQDGTLVLGPARHSVGPRADAVTNL